MNFSCVALVMIIYLLKKCDSWSGVTVGKLFSEVETAGKQFEAAYNHSWENHYEGVRKRERCRWSWTILWLSFRCELLVQLVNFVLQAKAVRILSSCETIFVFLINLCAFWFMPFQICKEFFLFKIYHCFCIGYVPDSCFYIWVLHDCIQRDCLWSDVIFTCHRATVAATVTTNSRSSIWCQNAAAALARVSLSLCPFYCHKRLVHFFRHQDHAATMAGVANQGMSVKIWIPSSFFYIDILSFYQIKPISCWCREDHLTFCGNAHCYGCFYICTRIPNMIY